jgi:thiol:disulfide interchange protein/DsbC/DsbD-like thiol-disulfide interchange protein
MTLFKQISGWMTWGWVAIGLLPGGAAEAAPLRVEAGQPTPHVRVMLHLDRDGVLPGESFQAALEFVPEPGWHTYWRNPGDIGLAPRLSWSLSPGVEAGTPLFEIPERVSATGKYINFGFERPNLITSEIRVSQDIKPGGTLALNLQARWLVCRETCVPGRAEFKVALAVQDPAQGVRPGFVEEPELFARSRARRPDAWPKDWSASLSTGTGDPARLRVSIQSSGATPLPVRFKQLEFFPATKGLIRTGSPITVRERGPRKLVLEALLEGEAKVPDTLTGLLLIDGHQGWERLGEQVQSASPSAPVLESRSEARAPEPATLDLWFALPSAFLGGLLLNLMPCVFPVLWLKVLSFLQASHLSRRRRLKDAGGYALGIVAAFVTLAGVLMLLRAGGQELGWGFQLQSPGFVLAVAALFFLISLNLLGLFEVGAELSGRLARVLGQGGMARGQEQGESWLGSAGTGVLAVIVATPCTAPFMGGALGYALSAPAISGLLVFAMLGLGLAFPYIALSLWPGLGRLLPRPGAWMERFKKALALPMLLTVVWLLWVLTLQRGGAALGVALILGLALLVLALTLKRAQRGEGGPKLAVLATLLMGVALGISVLGVGRLPRPAVMAQSQGSSSGLGSTWQAWSPEVEAQARQAGPVFIDFTAAWCVTCQVNEGAALSRASVIEAFRKKRVTLLKADWTDEDPRITKALAAYGRTGVPLYVLIPAQGDPILLPQILSPSLVTKALEGLPAAD